MAWLVYAMSIMMTIAVITQGNDREMLITATWAIAVSSMAQLVFARPKVILFDEGITIVNPFLTITTGWHRVDAIDAKFTMSILVGPKTIYAWAAPAPGRYHSRSIHETDLRGMRVDSAEMIRPGESPRSHSGAATYLARIRLENFRNRDLTGVDSSVEFNSVGIAVLLLSVTAAVALTYLQF
jgi:hypothetical protein